MREGQASIFGGSTDWPTCASKLSVSVSLMPAIPQMLCIEGLPCSAAGWSLTTGQAAKKWSSSKKTGEAAIVFGSSSSESSRWSRRLLSGGGEKSKGVQLQVQVLVGVRVLVL